MSNRDVVGVTNVEGPPVPIPNTEVKLNSAENTWMEASWEDRSTPTSFLLITYSSLAQSVERMTVNHDVAGSSPAGGAIYVVRKDYYTQKSLIFKDFSCY